MTPTRPVPLTRVVAGSRVHVLFSQRSDGDFHLDPHDDGVRPAGLDRRRRALVDLPWTQPDEVHGNTVVVVERPGDHDGVVADALVTSCDGAVLGIWVGDCAPVALIGDDGTIGAVHAGWKGAEAGVLQAAVDTVRRLGAERITAVLGPCIHPCCYEFGDEDLDRLAARHGPAVVGRTAVGARALDMRALVAAALAECAVTLEDHSVCTGCAADTFFSHRVRADRGRQVMAVWREASP